MAHSSSGLYRIKPVATITQHKTLGSGDLIHDMTVTERERCVAASSLSHDAQRTSRMTCSRGAYSTSSTAASGTGTVGSRFCSENDNGFDVLGLSQQEIVEQQNAMRMIRREKHRRISAALRHRTKRPPFSLVDLDKQPTLQQKLPEDCELSHDHVADRSRSWPQGDHMISDDEVILEQLRILQSCKNKELQGREIDASSVSSLSDCSPTLTTITASNVDNDTTMSYETTIAYQQTLDDEIQATTSEVPLPSSPFASIPLVSRSPDEAATKKPTQGNRRLPCTTSDHNRHCEDSTFRLGTRTVLHIKGTQHVYDKIMHGKRMIFTQCVACESISQVDGDGCRLLYCMICQQVGPIRELSTCRHDGNLATALQLQERAVEGVRKSCRSRAV